MLVIRKEQIEVMNLNAAATFEQELVEHVKKFAPRHSEAIGDAAVEEAVRFGMERARKYEFTKRGPVRFYIETMVMLGSEFDNDPLLPWASGVLNNEQIKDEMERADILHEELLTYLDEIAGKDKKLLFNAIKKIGRTQIEDYQSAGGSYETAMKSMLNSVHPEKCKYLGEEAIDGLIARGKASAQEQSFSTAKGAGLVTFLIFGLGHGILNDPLFPWIRRTLEDETIADPNEKAAQLKAKMKHYLEQTLKNLGQE